MVASRRSVFLPSRPNGGRRSATQTGRVVQPTIAQGAHRFLRLLRFGNATATSRIAICARSMALEACCPEFRVWQKIRSCAHEQKVMRRGGSFIFEMRIRRQTRSGLNGTTGEQSREILVDGRCFHDDGSLVEPPAPAPFQKAKKKPLRYDTGGAKA